VLRVWVFAALLFGGMATAQMRLFSPAFPDGGAIPARYTCDGADLSPPLVFEGVPPEAKALALLVWDPDAPGGVFFHWSAYNLSPKRQGLPEGVPRRERVEEFLQGKNDFGRLGYGGPCPPPGDRPHRYVFRLYALKAPLRLSPGADPAQVVRALEAAERLSTADWVGLYAR